MCPPRWCGGGGPRWLGRAPTRGTPIQSSSPSTAAIELTPNLFHDMQRRTIKHGAGSRTAVRSRSLVRVVVVAEWYPSPGDPVHGVWAHRQTLAARDAGAEVRVLALRRPVPPIEVVRRGGLGRWLANLPGSLKPMVLDGLQVESVPFVSPPRPWSYGA